MEFPVKYINPLRRSGKLQSSLDTLADIAIESINSGKLESLEKFCQGYIRNAGSLSDNEGLRLRKVVSCLVFDYGVLRNSSIEIQWDIVCTYGAQNYTKTVQYLDSLPSFFHPKMKRLLLVCQPNRIAASVVFNSTFVEIITHDWMVELKKQSPEMYLVAHHYDVDSNTRQLRSLFPQLSINRAQRLLRNSTIEQATQQLLDNQDAGKQPEKKVFKPIQKNSKLAYTPDYERTLKLANALLDDERDDEPEDESDAHIRVFDSQVGEDTDEHNKEASGEQSEVKTEQSETPIETKDKKRSNRRQREPKNEARAGKTDHPKTEKTENPKTGNPKTGNSKTGSSKPKRDRKHKNIETT